MNGTLWRGGLLVVVSATGFGLMPIFALYAYAAGLNVPTLLLLRFTLAAIVLLAYLASTGRLRALSRRELGALALLGAVLYALQALCYFSAVQYISPALAVLLLYSYPAMVVLLSAALNRALPSVSGLASIGLSLVGMAFVVGSPGQLNLVGVALAVGAAIVYAVYIIVGDRVSSRVSPLSTSAFVALFASMSFAVTGAATGSLHFDFAPGGWWPVIGVAIVSTVIAIGCFFAGVNAIGPTRASILSMVEPVVSIAAAALLLGVSMTGWQRFGGAVVLVGAAWGVMVANPAPPVRSTTEPDDIAQVTQDGDGPRRTDGIPR
jgi:drug/metabolite transporter (DMT)-like permease